MGVQRARKLLIAFAVEWLAKWSSHDAGDLLGSFPKEASRQLEPYRKLLAGGETPAEPEPGSSLLSIFSRVHKEGTEPPQRYWRASGLTLQPVAAVGEAEAHAADLAALWEGFAGELAQLLELHEGDALRFEAFTHLLHRWAWAVPCSYGEPGVSLYDEFRALSALVHASDCADVPAEAFTLLGGDIPGIQDFVYTITSKGAAKGLRGRSFFIQLLGDAVVRRVLADLELPEANVIYAAGGNFMLLAPAGVGTEETALRVRRQVNAHLVEAIQGDTALVLETMPVPADDLVTPSLFKKARDRFGQQIARAKSQPLRELADNWATLFEPKGKGSRLSCAVCRVEVDEHNSKLLERTGEEREGAETPRICYLCDSFGELARDIRHAPLWIAVEDASALLETEVQPKDGWPELLARMTGYRYAFSAELPQTQGTVLAIDQPHFLQAGACGFRLLANVTPRTTKDDIRYLREEAKWDKKDIPHEGEIRSFTLLAHAAAVAGAIERVGVLRMDVDGLGWVFSEGVPDLTLPKLSALSWSVERFFGGILNTLVREQAENDLYVIYAGGDDLFVVGAWHHLPDLAEAIHDQFKAFTGDNPALSLSGGITLEGAKFPLYRAAERAGEAEGKAKGHTRPSKCSAKQADKDKEQAEDIQLSEGWEKDALCFLDTVVGWEDWVLVRQQKDELLWLVGHDDKNLAKKRDERERRLPRGLLQAVQTIHQLYRTGLRDARRRVRRKNRDRPPDKPLPLPDERLFYGRWVWMKVYSLTRLGERGKRDVPDAPERIKELQKAILKPATVRYSGLAARWAEYSVRTYGQITEDHPGT